MANDDFDLPRPTDAVPSATSAVINDDAKVLDYVINGTGTVTTRTGKQIMTIDQAIQGAAPVPLNGGVWASGQTFEFYNQYMYYDGLAYAPLPATTLPYTVGAAPDLGFVYQIKLNSLQLLSGLADPSGLDGVYARGFNSVSDMTSSTSTNIGDRLSTGATSWEVVSVPTSILLSSGLYAKALTPIHLLDFGISNGVDCHDEWQLAQDASEDVKLPVILPPFDNLTFEGGLTYKSWLEWRGAGRFNTTVKPSSLDNTVVGDTHWVRKADKTADTKHLLMQDFGIDGNFAGGFPSGIDFVGWCRNEADGSNDKDITYLRLHFVDIPFDATEGRVTKNSGGTINGIRMLFCSAGTNHQGTPNRNCNQFKTMHGTIDNPGPYGEYPITNIVSFGNESTHMRSLCDFKRGSRHFYHNASTVVDMSDVCSISVDGAKDGTIGADNTGYQTNAFADAKNFYEIQGEDIEVLGGVWDANDRTGAVAGLLVTDYIYPAEEVAGVYDSNPSVNVNCHAITVRNIDPAQSAVRYINTKTCDVRGVNAFNIGFAAVSFEYQSGKKDILGNDVFPQGNSVDHIKERDCAWALSVSSDYPSKVTIGGNISDADGQQNILIENSLASEPAILPLDIPQELNINKDFENYAGTAQQPLGWQSGTATRNVQTADKPYGVLKAIELEDTSNTLVQSCSSEFVIPCSQGDVFYITLDTKLGTSTRSSLNVQEFTDSTFVSSSFITLNATSDWERRVRMYKVVGASTTRLILNINPAANSNIDTSFVGTSFFSNFRISRKLNNYK